MNQKQTKFSSDGASVREPIIDALLSAVLPLQSAHPGAVFAIACSGGRDSMALLDAARQAGLPAVAVHVNHGLRPTADRDENVVRAYCARYGIPCVVFPAPDTPLSGSEASARTYRYTSFERVLERKDADYILTAHHAEDNAETVLLHLTRGCGESGFLGMSVRRGAYLRPLLSVTRSQLAEYAARNGVPYENDETNDDPRFARNRIRAQVMPVLNSVNPRAVQAINRGAAKLSETLGELDRLLEPALPELREGIVRIPLAWQHEPFSSRRIFLSVRKLLPVDAASRHVDEILNLFAKPCGACAPLECGLYAYREDDAIVLAPAARREIPPPPERWFLPDAPCRVFHARVELTPTISREIPDKPTLAIDGAAVPNGAVWRARLPGDRFTPYGGGTRPLKEFFIDKKYPARLRDKCPLLCYNNVVLVVVGIEIARDVRITKESHRIVTIGAPHEGN